MQRQKQRGGRVFASSIEERALNEHRREDGKVYDDVNVVVNEFDHDSYAVLVGDDAELGLLTKMSASRIAHSQSKLNPKTGLPLDPKVVLWARGKMSMGARFAMQARQMDRAGTESVPMQVQAQEESNGGARAKTRYNGKLYTVRTGERGGKYILVQDKKVYI
jgi:hypothetical protein